MLEDTTDPDRPAMPDTEIKVDPRSFNVINSAIDNISAGSNKDGQVLVNISQATGDREVPVLLAIAFAYGNGQLNEIQVKNLEDRAKNTLMAAAKNRSKKALVSDMIDNHLTAGKNYKNQRKGAGQRLTDQFNDSIYQNILVVGKSLSPATSAKRNIAIAVSAVLAIGGGISYLTTRHSEKKDTPLPSPSIAKAENPEPTQPAETQELSIESKTIYFKPAMDGTGKGVDVKETKKLLDIKYNARDIVQFYNQQGGIGLRFTRGTQHLEIPSLSKLEGGLLVAHEIKK